MAASKPLKRQYHSGVSIGTNTKYNSVSNNESCSGESAEDQKEKPVAAAPTNHRSDVIPGSDMDKREKIRQQNEKKHQHQRERRAQELHELCNSYLMSRKLEALAQQLVAMGFTSERATMALILNDGRVEESVNWLLQGGEEGTEQVDVSTLSMGGNLKLDMSEEHKRIADMELRFKCSKREVERAVIACDGDLEKAMETLKARNQEPPPPTSTAPPKTRKIEDPSKVVMASVATASNLMTARMNLSKAVAHTVILQQRRDETNFNYTKAGTVNRNMQPPRGVPSKPASVVVMQVEKRWPTLGSSPPSYPARYVVANAGIEGRAAVQQQQVREPVIVIQPPQTLQPKQSPVVPVGLSATSPPLNTGWHLNGLTGIDMLKMNGGDLGQRGAQPQFYKQNHYQNSWNASVGLNTMPSSRVSPSSSSLGFFTGRTSLGTSGSSLSSLVDWNTDGTMPQLDYNNIDWSVDWSSTSGSGGPLYRPSSSHKGLSRPPQASEAYLADPAPVDGLTVRPGGSAPTPADAAVGGCRVGCLNGNPLMGMISCVHLGN